MESRRIHPAPTLPALLDATDLTAIDTAPRTGDIARFRALRQNPVEARPQRGRHAEPGPVM